MPLVTIVNIHTHAGRQYFPGQPCEMTAEEAKWYYDNIATERKAVAEVKKEDSYREVGMDQPSMNLKK